MLEVLLQPDARSQMLRAVSAMRRSNVGAVEHSSGTLGALLYADRAKPRVPESEWVELVQSVATGDQLALHALYERSHRVVFTLILRITQDRETAEEVTIDVFHEVWRRAAAYDPAAGSVLGWILNQARSRAIDRLRFDRRKKRVRSAPDDLHAHSVAEEPGFDRERRRLQRALPVLTDDERAAIEAAFFLGLSHTEVAARLGAPLGTIKTRIRSGLAKLRAALAASEEAT
jgi:RNA polymerase sigma-70 factor (ECF subfamily)